MKKEDSDLTPKKKQSDSTPLGNLANLAANPMALFEPKKPDHVLSDKQRLSVRHHIRKNL